MLDLKGVNTIENSFLTGHFLVAMPALDAGIFKSSVTYICEHNTEGAMGIMINRPSTLCLQDVLGDVIDDDAILQKNSHPVMVGGPIDLERGFVLHPYVSEAGWASSVAVSSDVMLTSSKDILLAINEGSGPENYLVALGYAGWGAGQLEQELSENAWLTTPAQQDILFSTPYHRRVEAAVNLLGIDFASLATTAGNA